MITKTSVYFSHQTHIGWQYITLLADDVTAQQAVVSKNASVGSHPQPAAETSAKLLTSSLYKLKWRKKIKASTLAIFHSSTSRVNVTFGL